MQGRDPKMSKMLVIAGIDVSKDKLDIHILPSNQTFVVNRDPRGLTDLARRLRKAGVEQVALKPAATTNASSSKHWRPTASSSPAQSAGSAPLPRRSAFWPRPTRSTPG